MKNCRIFAVFLLFGWAHSYQTPVTAGEIKHLLNTQAEKKQRIISLGGDITEILYAMHAEQQLVGVDTTSQWPKAALLLPKVGYFRALSAEGILSLSPDLLLLSNAAGPPSVIEQLHAMGVQINTVSSEKTTAGIVAKVRSIASALNMPERGNKLVNQIQADFNALKTLQKNIHIQPRVAFLFSVAKDNLMAGGRQTAADAMIKLAGGLNVFTEYTGYKPVNSEVLITAAPDVLLLTERVLESLGGIESVLNFPGVALTPAGKNKRIIVMDTRFICWDLAQEQDKPR